MCWVMPPASRATTLACLMASSSLVLPWSTWPMTVTTGGRGLQVGVLALVLTELDVEGLQQLPVLLLGGDDLDVVVELGAEQLQGLVVHRLGGGHHLAEVEEHLDERGRVHPDLVGEVAQRRAPGQPDDLAVPARDLDAADRGRLHVVELLAPLLTRLAAARGTPAGTPERALGAAAAAAATGTAAATTHTGPGERRRPGPPRGPAPAPGPPRAPPGRGPVPAPPGPPRPGPPGPPRPGPPGRGGMLLGLGRGPPGRGPPGRCMSAGLGRPGPPPAGRGPPGRADAGPPPGPAGPAWPGRGAPRGDSPMPVAVGL